LLPAVVWLIYLEKFGNLGKSYLAALTNNRVKDPAKVTGRNRPLG